MSARFLSDRYQFKKWPKRIAAFVLDLTGYILFGPARFLHQQLPVKSRMKILAIRLDQMGDIVMVKPALDALLDQFPDAEIDFLTSSEGAALFENDRRLHEVIRFHHNWFNASASCIERKVECRSLLKKMRAHCYDLAIDFRGDLRMIWLMSRARIPHRWGYGMTGGGFLLTYCGKYSRQSHQVLNNMNLLKGLGINTPPEMSPFIFEENEKDKTISIWGSEVAKLNAPRIVIHPAAGRPEKVWGSRRYGELMEQMLEKTTASIILIGTESEKESFYPIYLKSSRVCDLRGKTSLKELCLLFQMTDLFMGGDSGPAHLAACQGMRVISIFQGPNDPKVWHPWSARLQVISRSEGQAPGVDEVFSALLKACDDLKGESRAGV